MRGSVDPAVRPRPGDGAGGRDRGRAPRWNSAKLPLQSARGVEFRSDDAIAAACDAGRTAVPEDAGPRGELRYLHLLARGTAEVGLAPGGGLGGLTPTASTKGTSMTMPHHPAAPAGQPPLQPSAPPRPSLLRPGAGPAPSAAPAPPRPKGDVLRELRRGRARQRSPVRRQWHRHRRQPLHDGRRPLEHQTDGRRQPEHDDRDPGRTGRRARTIDANGAGIVIVAVEERQPPTSSPPRPPRGGRSRSSRPPAARSRSTSAPAPIGSRSTSRSKTARSGAAPLV